MTTPNILVNSLGMRFALIPAGAFQMGSPTAEPGRRPDEGPQRKVTSSRPFYMGVHPITQDQFARVAGTNPSSTFHVGHDAADNPVDCVSWLDAIDFCRKLANIGEEAQARYSYRLPTEAEWEYACRAGTTTAFFFGPVLVGSQAAREGVRGAVRVGSYPPNDFGLYDMHGNVWEWCSDWYGPTYDPGPAIDPSGPGEGTKRVLRGGRWGCRVDDCRSAKRDSSQPGNRMTGIGFRVVLVQ